MGKYTMGRREIVNFPIRGIRSLPVHHATQHATDSTEKTKNLPQRRKERQEIQGQV
jgi:hypothetical protein